MGFGTKFGIRFGIDTVQAPSGGDNYVCTNVDGISVSDSASFSKIALRSTTTNVIVTSSNNLLISYHRYSSDNAVITTQEQVDVEYLRSVVDAASSYETTAINYLILLTAIESADVAACTCREYFTSVVDPIGIDVWYYPESADNFSFSCSETVNVNDYVGSETEVAPVNSVRYDYFRSNSFSSPLEMSENACVVQATLTTSGRFYLAKSMATGLVVIPYKFSCGLHNFPFRNTVNQEANEVDQVVLTGSTLDKNMEVLPSSATSFYFKCRGNINPIFISNILIYAYIRNSPSYGENFLEIPFASAVFPKRLITNSRASELIILVSL